MRISHMVEEHHKVQDMGKVVNKDIIHQGSSSSNIKERIEMNIKVRRGINHLRSKCCSSWGTTKSCLTSMNKNLLSWTLLNPTHKFLKQTLMLHSRTWKHRLGSWPQPCRTRPRMHSIVTPRRDQGTAWQSS